MYAWERREFFLEPKLPRVNGDYEHRQVVVGMLVVDLKSSLVQHLLARNLENKD